ncbi:hypothetical protein [Actinoplanes rectilineatus]|uniref:hypothetical protein n=1 Tax=Actinoplanes rectilineatus TaxID=113571 RepID=UPI0005F2EC30|nr:hypothetical protein [Actinoplanes rectilineatus]
MTEPAIDAAEVALRSLRADLAGLHDWAERVLNSDGTDRQYIAEHLSGAAAALAAGEPLPPAPYADDTDEF